MRTITRNSARRLSTPATEAAIIDATLVAVLNGGSGPTSTEQIAESNLQSGTQASANTNAIQSNTNLSFEFTAVGGRFVISFDAVIDVKSINWSGCRLRFGTSRQPSVSVILQSGGQSLASWVPGAEQHYLCRE
ncbi:MAG: hypothetical protein R3E50_04875 [Halioglobus sp.]